MTLLKQSGEGRALLEVRIATALWLLSSRKNLFDSGKCLRWSSLPHIHFHYRGHAVAYGRRRTTLTPSLPAVKIHGQEGSTVC